MSDSLKGAVLNPYVVRGYSTYEIAKLNGFVGTEKEWLESLTQKSADKAAAIVEEMISTKIIVQTAGYSENNVMSQGAVTKEISKIGDAVGAAVSYSPGNLSSGVYVTAYHFIPGHRYRLTNTSESAGLSAGTRIENKGSDTEIITDYIGATYSVEFVPIFEAFFLRVYFTSAGGSIEIVDTDGLANRAANYDVRISNVEEMSKEHDMLFGIPFRATVPMAKTTAYKFRMEKGRKYFIRNISTASPTTMNVYVGNTEKIDTSTQVVTSLGRRYSAEFVAPIDSTYFYVYCASNDGEFEIFDKEGYETKLAPLLGVPSYYKDHMLEKTIRVNGMNDESGIYGDTFVFLTDYHRQANTERSASLVKYVFDNTGARFMMFGGDAQDYEKSKDGGIEQLQQFKEKFSQTWDKTYAVIGNHECNPYTVDGTILADYQLSYNQIYRLLIKDRESGYGAISPYGNYWFDNPVQKIRYFATSSDGYANMDEDSVVWMLNQFKEVPDGYYIVVFAHLTYTNTPEDVTRCYLSSGTQWIAEALDAYNKREAYTLVTSGIERGVFDYSGCGGEALCIIGGHSHFDMDSTQESLIVPRYWSPTIPDIMVTSTTTDAFIRQSENINPLNRQAGTVNEQAFDVVHLDTKNKVLIMTRIGAGPDRIFHLSPLHESTTLSTMLSGSVSWESTQGSVANVSNGIVSVVGTGRTRIVAKDADGNTESWTFKL